MDLRVREAAPVGRDLQAARWHGEVALRLFGTAPPTTTVGRYQLVERRGQGASGEVWAAIDPELDRRVALKILHAELGPEPAHAAMIREAKALAKLSHPNVLPVFDAGVHDGRVFMALELVEGT
ncbi:MAG: protein kinase, partial [Myxococcales bacterium]|nr:protein kinase [Myxococcales bacterium]